MDELLREVPELPLLILALVAVVLWSAARRAAVILVACVLLVFGAGVLAHEVGPALCYPPTPGATVLTG